MERIMLIVKGDERSAMDAAERHGFEVVTAHARQGETTLLTHGRIGLAAEWLCEPGEAPYSAGALLYYAERG